MKTATAVFAIFTIHTTLSFAEAPMLLNYQGKLTDAGGDPVTGAVDVVVNVYTNHNAGNSIYTEDIGTVPVEDGVYSFNWGDSGQSILAAVETLATVDGATSVYNYTVRNPPIVNPSVTITDGTYTWNDVTGSSSPSTFLGVVTSYENGQVSAVYLSGVPAAGTEISVSYSYNQGIVPALGAYDTLWLEISLNGEALTPRQRLVAVPYALSIRDPVVTRDTIGTWFGNPLISTTNTLDS